MHIFISTGEVSGDLQGSLLVEALFRQAEALNIDLKITALGGDRMAAAGATLLGNTTKIGSIGLIESLPYIIPTLRIQRQAKRYLKENPPDLVVLIDYIGPNIGIGNFVRRQLPRCQLFTTLRPRPGFGRLMTTIQRRSPASPTGFLPFSRKKPVTLQNTA